MKTKPQHKFLMKNHVHKLLLPLLLVAGTTMALAAAPPVPDLAWWAGEGNTLDSAGNNTASVTGTMKYVPGVVGQSFDFSSQAVLRVTNCPAMEPTGPFTISAWVNAINPGTFRVILCKPFGSGTSTYELYTGINGGLGGFFNFINPANGQPAFLYTPTADPGLVWDGLWHFAAQTYDGSDYYLYVDGRQVANLHTNITLLYASTNYNGDVRIGDFWPTNLANLHFNGRIDELKMYSRALTAQEMIDSFTCIETNLVSWWRAETNANDWIGSNHGTLQGSAKFDLGRYSQCFNLFGGSVQIADDVSLRPAQFTLEARVRASSPLTNTCLLSKSLSASSASYAFSSGPDASLVFTVTLPGGVVSSPAASASIWNDEFHSICGTYDGATVRLYVDGVEVGSGTAGSGAVQYGTGYNAGQLLFGDFDTTRSARNFTGWLDEVKLYNRAVSAQEVAARTPKTLSGFVMPPTLTVWQGATTNAFSVVALGGGGNNTYQWRHEGTNLGKTASALKLTNVQLSDAGQYDVQVTTRSISYVDGTNGQAFRMGTAGLVRIANSPDLEPQAITVQTWVRGATNQTYRYWLAKMYNAANSGSYQFYTGSGNGAVFFIRTGPSTIVLSPAATPQQVWDGRWHQVTGVFDGDYDNGGVVRLYVDGAEVGNGTPALYGIAYNSLFNNGDLLLGDINPPSAYKYTNDVDEVRIWKRALNNDEIATSLTNNQVAPESLVLWLRGEGNVVNSATNVLNTLAFPQPASCITDPGFLTVRALEPARLSNCVIRGGYFYSDVVGSPGATYVIQAASGLGSWAPIATNTSPFTFSEVLGSGPRFYRAVSQ